jgi:uncharacterized protein YciW
VSKIKTFGEFLDDNKSQNFTYEHAYNSALKSARLHHEEEVRNLKAQFEEDQVATLEYSDQVLRRTSDINLEIAMKIAALADEIPEPGERFDAEHLSKVCIEFSEAVKKFVKEKE